MSKAQKTNLFSLLDAYSLVFTLFFICMEQTSSDPTDKVLAKANLRVGNATTETVLTTISPTEGITLDGIWTLLSGLGVGSFLTGIITWLKTWLEARNDQKSKEEGQNLFAVELQRALKLTVSPNSATREWDGFVSFSGALSKAMEDRIGIAIKKHEINPAVNLLSTYMKEHLLDSHMSASGCSRFSIDNNYYPNVQVFMQHYINNLSVNELVNICPNSPLQKKQDMGKQCDRQFASKTGVTLFPEQKIVLRSLQKIAMQGGGTVIVTANPNQPGLGRRTTIAEYYGQVTSKKYLLDAESTEAFEDHLLRLYDEVVKPQGGVLPVSIKAKKHRALELLVRAKLVVLNSIDAPVIPEVLKRLGPNQDARLVICLVDPSTEWIRMDSSHLHIEFRGLSYVSAAEYVEKKMGPLLDFRLLYQHLKGIALHLSLAVAIIKLSEMSVHDFIAHLDGKREDVNQMDVEHKEIAAFFLLILEQIGMHDPILFHVISFCSSEILDRDLLGSHVLSFLSYLDANRSSAEFQHIFGQELSHVDQNKFVFSQVVERLKKLDLILENPSGQMMLRLGVLRVQRNHLHNDATDKGFFYFSRFIGYLNSHSKEVDSQLTAYQVDKMYRLYKGLEPLVSKYEDRLIGNEFYTHFLFHLARWSSRASDYVTARKFFIKAKAELYGEDDLSAENTEILNASIANEINFGCFSLCAREFRALLAGRMGDLLEANHLLLYANIHFNLSRALMYVGNIQGAQGAQNLLARASGNCMDYIDAHERDENLAVYRLHRMIARADLFLSLLQNQTNLRTRVDGLAMSHPEDKDKIHLYHMQALVRCVLGRRDSQDPMSRAAVLNARKKWATLLKKDPGYLMSLVMYGMNLMKEPATPDKAQTCFQTIRSMSKAVTLNVFFIGHLNATLPEELALLSEHCGGLAVTAWLLAMWCSQIPRVREPLSLTELSNVTELSQVAAENLDQHYLAWVDKHADLDPIDSIIANVAFMMLALRARMDGRQEIAQVALFCIHGVDHIEYVAERMTHAIQEAVPANQQTRESLFAKRRALKQRLEMNVQGGALPILE